MRTRIMRMRYPVTKACDMKRWIALLKAISKAGYETNLLNQIYELAMELNPACQTKCGTDIKKCQNIIKPEPSRPDPRPYPCKSEKKFNSLKKRYIGCRKLKSDHSSCKNKILE